MLCENLEYKCKSHKLKHKMQLFDKFEFMSLLQWSAERTLFLRIPVGTLLILLSVEKQHLLFENFWKTNRKTKRFPSLKVGETI